MIVVDASALVGALTGVGVATERLSDQRLVAPALLDAEVGSATRRTWISGQLDPELAHNAVASLPALEILRFEHRPLIARAWELRHDVTFADALYLALAEQLDIPLVTFDARMAAAPGITATVEVLRRS